MSIAVDDRLPVWRLCKSADMPRFQLVPILRDAGLPIEADPDTGDVVTSRSAFGAFLRRAVEAQQ